MLTGVTLIRNGNKLKYPWKECVNNLRALCHEVWVNCDPTSDDGTMEDLQDIKERARYGLNIYPSEWDMSNTGDGRELAVQINYMLPKLPKGGWVVYLQADELINDHDFVNIRSFLQSLPMHITQVELFRTYFWQDLRHRLTRDEIWLGRIFRAGTHTVGGDGMHLVRHSGHVIRSPFWIYHYSRIGDERDITARVRTLDRLFHSEEKVLSMPDFSYSDPSGKVVEYRGTHPGGIEKFYQGDKE